MQVGMIGLGRMGANMTQRLVRAKHACIVYDIHPPAVEAVVKQGAAGAASLEDFVRKIARPRPIWMMLPAAVVEPTIASLIPLLEAGDMLIDGGNSFYQDDIRRATELAPRKIHYIDVGVSGGVWGLDRGYCLMIGGEPDAVKSLTPIFSALAPGIATAPRTRARDTAASASTAEQGFLHCGTAGAGHFVKMVHNGIEYGLMAAYAQGLNILKHANVGKQTHLLDAETAPLRHPEHYQFDIDLKEVAELWRRGTVIGSWLLDLTADALCRDSALKEFEGRVADSGEGRWTIAAALDEAVPAPVLAAALFDRFASRGQAGFADRLMSAMRYEFGGHVERK